MPEPTGKPIAGCLPSAGASATVVLDFDVAFWTTALGSRVLSVLGDWAAKGWVTLGDGEPPVSARIEPGTWSALSVAGHARSSEDELVQLAEHADLLTRLVRSRGGSVLITSTSFVGAPILVSSAR